MNVLGPIDERLAAYCRALPKVELHAHIHGSIRPSTLEEVLQEEARWKRSEPLQLPTNRSLDECFEMFRLIHQVVVSRRVLRRIVVEAVEDFAADNVKYLELRSTPRDLPRDGATPSEYVDEVVSALEECQARNDLDIEVRLLLSINRNQPVTMAEETVSLALERKRRGCPFIVGIDLSGNSERPNSEFYRFEHELARACQGGLKLAVHFAEHFDDDEAARILRFRPDRLGHACCLSEPLYAKMLAMRIPIEVCLTSNVHTLARYRSDDDCQCAPHEKHAASGLCVCGFTSHPHGKLLAGERDQEQEGDGTYPMCICTDDYGVLDTTLSIEYMRAAQAFDLSESRLLEIAEASVGSIFDVSQVPKLAAAFTQKA